jgi:FkbM family methyltransferase
MFKSPLRTRRFKRFARALSYQVPRFRLLYRVCKLYVDNYHGDNNADMEINGELRFLGKTLASLNENPVVFDIGANRGQWTRAVLAIKPGARIHCFEPARCTWEELQARGFPPNVVCNRAGMGESVGTLKLYVNPSVSELSSIYGGNGNGAKAEEVPIGTVDGYCRERGISSIDYLKIDVEGHELAVLKGAREMLSRQGIRFAQFEYGSWYIRAHVFLRDVFRFLEEFNYELWKVMPNGLQRISKYSERLERFENACYVLAPVDSAQNRGAGELL